MHPAGSISPAAMHISSSTPWPTIRPIVFDYSSSRACRGRFARTAIAAAAPDSNFVGFFFLGRVDDLKDQTQFFQIWGVIVARCLGRC
jgi:hypothetical protein